jgi:uncharacterized caspase-like protein
MNLAKRAPAKSGVGTLISFSTQPVNVALDGTGRNSPFTGPVVKRIGTPHEDILSVLTAVRNDMLAATSEKQAPWEGHTGSKFRGKTGAGCTAQVLSPTTFPVRLMA